MTVHSRDQVSRAGEPWQLAMFRKGLKKRLRLKALEKLLKPVAPHERCLLLTCGDNNGAMNYFLRELGGQWSWADLEDHSIAEMSALLGDPVVHATEHAIPFADSEFDRIVVIDVHEHVDDPRIVNAELARILKPGAQMIVTTEWRREKARGPNQEPRWNVEGGLWPQAHRPHCRRDRGADAR